MLRVIITNPVANALVYSHISLFCMKCNREMAWHRRPGESMGVGLRDHCPKCNQLLPTLDYLIADSEHVDNTEMRLLSYGGKVI